MFAPQPKLVLGQAKHNHRTNSDTSNEACSKPRLIFRSLAYSALFEHDLPLLFVRSTAFRRENVVGHSLVDVPNPM